LTYPEDFFLAQLALVLLALLLLLLGAVRVDAVVLAGAQQLLVADGVGVAGAGRLAVAEGAHLVACLAPLLELALARARLSARRQLLELLALLLAIALARVAHVFARGQLCLSFGLYLFLTEFFWA
jgi:hypothetical protein